MAYEVSVESERTTEELQRKQYTCYRQDAAGCPSTLCGTTSKLLQYPTERHV